MPEDTNAIPIRELRLGEKAQPVESGYMSVPESTWGLASPLSAVPSAVNQCVADYFAASTQEFAAIGPQFAHAISLLREFTVDGGKRVRPMFAWAGIRAGVEGGGGSFDFPFPDATPDPQSLLTAISAMEFIQACALIHDDIIDQSDTRRGSPTTHRRFTAQHREHAWAGESEHYGTSQAILTGDLALAWADDMFGMSGISAQALRASRNPWRAMRTEVIAGQILDVTLEANGSESVEDSLKVIEYKTASYTVARPLHIGAALVGADEAVVSTLRQIGQDIGEAFQLRDDQLGVFGKPEITGKPSGDDLRTGKRTALINQALINLAEGKGVKGGVEKLRNGLGAVDTEEEIDELRGVIVESGAAADIEEWITRRSQRAIETIRGANLGAEITEEMVDVTAKLSDRKY